MAFFFRCWMSRNLFIAFLMGGASCSLPPSLKKKKKNNDSEELIEMCGAVLVGLAGKGGG